jgi:HEPN domain-containing protein
MARVKYFKAAQGYSCEELLHAAADHLFAADLLYQSGVRCLDSAGYLAHLGVELILKAVLLDLEGQFPGTHDIEELYGRTVTHDSGFRLDHPSESVLEALNKYRNLRYPQPRNMPGVAAGDREAVNRLVHQIKARMPDALVEMLTGPSETVKSGRSIITRKDRRDNT